MNPPYWHSDEWRALLLAVVADPDDEVRRAKCADWLSERGEHVSAERWQQPDIMTVFSGTSAAWYSSRPVAMCAWCVRDGYEPACVRCVQDGERVYPCKELAWTLPIREVVFVDDISQDEWLHIAGWYPCNRSELALRFARSDKWEGGTEAMRKVIEAGNGPTALRFARS